PAHGSFPSLNWRGRCGLRAFPEAGKLPWAGLPSSFTVAPPNREKLNVVGLSPADFIPNGITSQLAHGVETEFVHDVRAVRLHRLHAQIQPGGNLFAALAFRGNWMISR